jgi:hypothetical protein
MGQIRAIRAIARQGLEQLLYVIVITQRRYHMSYMVEQMSSTNIFGENFE